MIQDIAPHQLDMTYHPEYKPKEDSPVMYFEGRDLLCDLSDDGELRFPEKKDLGAEDLLLTHIFTLDGEACFLARAKAEKLPADFAMNKIDLFRTAKPRELAMAAVTAYHLSVWYSSNAYCGRCGHKTGHDSVERMMRCPECGNMIFPKIMPSVIVGVINGDKLLLERYNRPGAKLGALVAGFTEIGETIEETVRREVMEEVGLKVKNLRFYKSQPWGISGGGLLFGFWCELDGSDEIRPDGFEIAEAVWRSREELQDSYTDTGISLTGEMISRFARGEENL